MATLTDNQKTFIIKQLAYDQSPKEIQELVRNHFDIEVTTSQIVYYNPFTSRSGHLAPKWQKKYNIFRKKFIEDLSDVPGYHKAFRVRKLMQYVEYYEKQGAYLLAAQLLEQIAKEVGGVYERQNLLTPREGSSGGDFFQQINQTIINQQNGDR